MFLKPGDLLKTIFIRTNIIFKVWGHLKVTFGNYGEDYKKKGGIFKSTYFKLIRKTTYGECGRSLNQALVYVYNATKALIRIKRKKWVYLS